MFNYQGPEFYRQHGSPDTTRISGDSNVVFSPNIIREAETKETSKQLTLSTCQSAQSCGKLMC